MTPKPQPKVMTIQPLFWALELVSSTAATTPSPSRIRSAVPIVSAPMMLTKPYLQSSGGPVRRSYGSSVPKGNQLGSRGDREAQAWGATGCGSVASEKRPLPLEAALPRAGARSAPWDSKNSITRAITSEPCSPSRGVIGSPKWMSTLIARLVEAALGPVLAGRHRLVRAGHVDRHDREAVLGGQGGRAGAQLADPAVARARALGVHQEVPALVDQAVDVVGRAVSEAAAAALDRHGVEHERDERRRRALLVEVVGRRRDRRALAPLARQRAQDHRRVEVAGVVGDEDDRRLELLEALGAVRAHAHVVVDHRAQHAAQDRLAHVARDAAARPRHVQARHALACRGALAGDAAAEVTAAGRRRARRPFRPAPCRREHGRARKDRPVRPPCR